MGLARSTFYDVAPVPLEPAELVARIGAICDEFECYGYRRVGAALRHQGVVVNSKKLRRLMGSMICSRSGGDEPPGHGAVGKAASGAFATAVKRVPSRAPCPASAPAKTPVRACRRHECS